LEPESLDGGDMTGESPDGRSVDRGGAVYHHDAALNIAGRMF
jgi:hypothetical protein